MPQISIILGVVAGGQALGIETVLVTTGDFVALGDRATTTDVRDTDVCGLVEMARGAEISSAELSHQYSGVELNEITGVLKKRTRPIEHATLSYGYGFSVTRVCVTQA